MHKGRQTTLSNLFLPLSTDLALVSAGIMLHPESGLQNDRNTIGKNIREWMVWARTVGAKSAAGPSRAGGLPVSVLVFQSLCVMGLLHLEAGRGLRHGSWHPHFMGGETKAVTHLKSHS